MTSPTACLAQAREWQVLLHSGRATAADQAAVEAWRLASPDNARALREVEDLWALLGQLDPRSSAPPATAAAEVVPLTPRRARRSARWAVPLATAASLVLALWLPRGAWLGLYADESTAPGEIRELRLEDGSLLTLNGNTALDWVFVDGQRQVRLYRGEVDFQVAADATRPFLVAAGPARIRVTGTRFDVNHRGDDVLLAVTHGQVQASEDGGSPVPVSARQQVAWRAGQLQSVQALDAQRLAWQRGKLVFRARPLGEVFAELERCQSQRVVFLDAAARELQVTGVFALDDPQALLRAIESNLPVRLIRLPGVLLVASRD